MYEFKAIHDVIPEEVRISLSALFAHEPMGEIALEWTELIRSAMNAGIEIVLFKIHKNGGFTGIAILSIVRQLDWTRYLWKPITPFFKFFGRFDFGFLEVPFSNIPGLLTVEGADSTERGIMINELYAYIRRSLQLDTLCIKIDNSVRLAEDSPCSRKMASLSFYPNTLLEYPYESFDDFLNSLKRKKWRRWRVDRKALAQHSATVEICHDISSVCSDIYDLYQKTADVVKKRPHYMEMPVEINRDFFAELPLFRGLNPAVVLVKVNGVIIAYSLLMQSGSTIFFKAVGLDYDLSYKTRAYFNLYYATLDYASRQKCDKVDFGITSYHFKKWIGCELYPAAYLCDSSNKLLSLIQNPMARFIESRIGTGRRSGILAGENR